MTHATNKDDGGTDPIHALAAMEERLKAVEEYLGIIVGSANFTLQKASPEIASLVQEIQKNPLNAMCDNEGQTTNPLKESDRPTPEGLRICPDPTGEGSAWQVSPTPAEPAPGSDEEHPPEGYRLEPVGGKRAPGYVWWCPTTYKWQPAQMDMMGKTVYPSVVVANPIPANEGDSQKAGLSDEIAESVVQDLQQARYDRDELRATVERLTAENEELRKTNTSYHMTITYLNDRLRMIREVLR